MGLNVSGVSRSYRRKNGKRKEFTALKETDLQVGEGKLVLIVGPSGSGKSTLLNICAGILSPDKGTVTIGDRDLYSMKDEERSGFRNSHIGFVPQGHSVLKDLTVHENLILPVTMYGEEVEEGKAEELLRIVGIEKLSGEYADELSGGEMRRLSIARALVRDPELILADEPTGDLDRENREAVMKIFRSLADSGVSILMVTHDDEAVRYADEVYRMESGILSKVSG